MQQEREILQQLGAAESAHEAVESFYYHGSVENFDSAPRGGGYDGVFWCADNPAVAQCYIPAAGIETILTVSGYELRERVRPSMHSGWYGVVRQMGLESPDVEWDQFGRALSWRVPNGYPTHAEVGDWLERELGYQNRSDRPGYERHYLVKTSLDHGKETYLRADHREQGRLFVVEGMEELRFLDLTRDGGDLVDPDYHRVDLFQKAAAAGYDGIIIDDWCQSRIHGNVGHRSWGVLPQALHKLRYAVIPAVNFDWPENGPLGETVTPEFEAAWSQTRDVSPPPGLR